MKKWRVTRISTCTIEVESDTEPLTGDDKWAFEQAHIKELEEAYRDDGLSEFEVEQC